jgi:hypothetical protein
MVAGWGLSGELGDDWGKVRVACEQLLAAGHGEVGEIKSRGDKASAERVGGTGGGTGGLELASGDNGLGVPAAGGVEFEVLGSGEEVECVLAVGGDAVQLEGAAGDEMPDFITGDPVKGGEVAVLKKKVDGGEGGAVGGGGRMGGGWDGFDDQLGTENLSVIPALGMGLETEVFDDGLDNFPDYRVHGGLDWGEESELGRNH